MCLVILIFFIFDGFIEVKKNFLNGWGKGKNIQVDFCFDVRNSILIVVYKGRFLRLQGRGYFKKNGENLIIGKFNYWFFYLYYICNKGFYWSLIWVVGVLELYIF